jgi:hypothetical protein
MPRWQLLIADEKIPVPDRNLIHKKEFIMPTTIALRRARRDARQGKRPTTQAPHWLSAKREPPAHHG